MAGLDQIKEIVMKNIEDTGYLDQLRAQLKLQVFKIIDNQDDILKNNVGFQWEHPQQTQLKTMVHGQSSIQLIIEYLEFFKLDYTVQVLRKEAKLNEPTIREALANKIGLPGKPDTLKPLLIVLITEYLKNSNLSNQAQQQQTKQELTTNAAVTQKKPEPIKEQTKTDKIKVEPAKQETKINQNKEKQSEEQKKPQDRPQTAPLKKEEPPTAVNKIRGAKTSNVNNIYGFDVTGGANKSKTQYDDLISNPSDPYAFDLGGGKKNNADPYAFDIGGGNQKGVKQGVQKNADPYAFQIGSKTQQKSSDPYAFDIGAKKSDNQNDMYDFDLDAPVSQNKKVGNPYNKQDKNQATNKFNSQAYTFDINDNKSQKKGSKKEEIEEDIDDFMESRDDKAKQSNNMYTSSEDMMRATQSMGVDESVDSLALEDYDYYEDVTKKR